MIDFDPTPILYLGAGLAKLERVQQGTALVFVMYDVHEARQAVQHFIGNKENAMLFPETVGKLRDVLVWADVILPQNEPPQEIRTLTDGEVNGLAAAVNAATVTFDTETKRLFLAGLSHQRGYEPSVLVEKMQEIFSSDCWTGFSEFVKREIKECGRCLAFERYTAAGFHVLRALESMTRTYVSRCLNAEPQKRDLGYYIDVLGKNQANKKLIASLEEIRRLDRNPLVHPEDWLELDDAVNTLCICRTALDRLIGDMKQRNLIPATP